MASLNPDKNNVKVKKDAKKNDILSHSRQLITARQMSKIAKGDNPVFLAIIRETNEAPPRKKANKGSSVHVSRFTAAHGMSEGQRRSINKSQGLKKHIITVAEREQQVLDSVPICHREKLGQLIQKYHDIFPEQLPKGIPPKGGLDIR